MHTMHDTLRNGWPREQIQKNVKKMKKFDPPVDTVHDGISISWNYSTRQGRYAKSMLWYANAMLRCDVVP